MLKSAVFYMFNFSYLFDDIEQDICSLHSFYLPYLCIYIFKNVEGLHYKLYLLCLLVYFCVCVCVCVEEKPKKCDVLASIIC